MTNLIIAALIFGGGWLALQYMRTAQPTALVRYTKMALGGVALAASFFVLLRGSAALSLPLAAIGTWLIWGQAGVPWQGWPGRGTSAPRKASRVVTDHLEMVLDHDTGAMTGRVRKGFFGNRRIEDLRPVELAHLWQDCRFVDPQSAQLIEAYLDRIHPTWRDDMERQENQSPKGPDGRMTRVEALEILGLVASATDDEIRRAHRDLIMKLHPDKGGSTYLAAKINEAKDVALDRSRP